MEDLDNRIYELIGAFSHYNPEKASELKQLIVDREKEVRGSDEDK